MVARVSSVYRADMQKHGHQQTKDGSKKKEQVKFKDILVKALLGPLPESTECR